MEDLKKLADNKANPKKEKLSLGFGFFSTPETENDWRTYSYDGLESTRDFERKRELCSRHRSYDGLQSTKDFSEECIKKKETLLGELKKALSM